MEKSKLDIFTENIQKYVSTNIRLLKLETIEQVSVSGSFLISSLLISFVVVLFLIFASLSAGFFLSELFNNTYSGFACVAGFYFLTGLILFLSRKKLIERPIRDKIIREIFRDQNE